MAAAATSDYPAKGYRYYVVEYEEIVSCGRDWIGNTCGPFVISPVVRGTISAKGADGYRVELVTGKSKNVRSGAFQAGNIQLALCYVRVLARVEADGSSHRPSDAEYYRGKLDLPKKK